MVRTALVSISVMIGASFGLAVFSPAPAYAQVPKNCPSGKILTLKPWYDGLLQNDCSLKPMGSSADEQSKYIWRIALNIVEDLLQLVGFVTVGFIIFGGFTFLTSAGSPDQAANARKTITNAAIGLVIAMASIGLVNLVASTALGI